jgi:hypothetical protein
LILELKATAENLGLPIRAWISYADSYMANHPNLTMAAKRLGLSFKKAAVSWAAYEAGPGSNPDFLPSVRIPARPKGVREESKEADSVEPATTAEFEERMWARKAARSRARQAREDL